jgi:hypothetical protein
MLVAGVDSSTQSTKMPLCRAGTAPWSGGPRPRIRTAPNVTLGGGGRRWPARHGLLDRAEAIGIAAQQHAMVMLDAGGQVIRPALLCNDLRSAPQATALIAELGGPAQWAPRRSASATPPSRRHVRLGPLRRVNAGQGRPWCGCRPPGRRRRCALGYRYGVR